VKALIQTAYVPWAREVLDATDIGALKVQPQMAELRQVLADAAAAWGAGLEAAVLFVGRVHEPLRIPDGPGTFLLNPHQEAYAFLPATGRYRQLTAEDGHVVAIARTGDGRRLVYVTAKQWVRGTAKGDVRLRGVALNELTLATMTIAPPIAVDGELRRLELPATPRGIAFQLQRAEGTAAFLRGEGGTLVAYPGPLPRRTTRLAILTGRGAQAAPPVMVPGSCPVVARDLDAAAGRTVVLSGRGRTPPRETGLETVLGARFGAGLTGLPLP
jgi:hypothetical protein